MIGRLAGIVIHRETNALILDVGGVGYLIRASQKTLDQGIQGDPLTLWIETRVREDSFELFGFVHKEEQSAFVHLCKISGVGAKVALSVLSFLTPSALSQAVLSEAGEALRSVPGVGPKMATRILTELRGSLDSWNSPAWSPSSSAPEGMSDALRALTQLGYPAHTAQQALSGLPKQGQDTQDLVRAALRKLQE